MREEGYDDADIEDESDMSSPAFPGGFVSGHSGLTKREWFAGMALAGIMANSDYTQNTCYEIKRIAYLQADSMLKKGEK